MKEEKLSSLSFSWPPFSPYFPPLSRGVRDNGGCDDWTLRVADTSPENDSSSLRDRKIAILDSNSGCGENNYRMLTLIHDIILVLRI